MTESREVGQYAYIYMSSSQYLDAYYRVIGPGSIVLVTLPFWLHYMVVSLYITRLVDWLRGWLIGLGSIVLVTLHGWVYRPVQINIST